jgi:hypothetical protein
MTLRNAAAALFHFTGFFGCRRRTQKAVGMAGFHSATKFGSYRPRSRVSHLRMERRHPAHSSTKYAAMFSIYLIRPAALGPGVLLRLYQIWTASVFY